jgi:hypothetical protein
VSRRKFTAPFALLLMLGAFFLLAAETDDQNQAGLVVDFGDGQVEAVCVRFAEAEITGFELLQRSGLALEVEAQGLGAAVCRIDTTGCPADNCFCQCRGDACEYWSYWHQNDGVWEYSAAGAAVSRVMPEEVEGWSWGPGSVTEAVPPAQMSFADICADPTRLPTGENQLPAITPDPEAAAEAAIWPYMVMGMVIGALVTGVVLLRQAKKKAA